MEEHHGRCRGPCAYVGEDVLHCGVEGVASGGADKPLLVDVGLDEPRDVPATSKAPSCKAGELLGDDGVLRRERGTSQRSVVQAEALTDLESASVVVEHGRLVDEGAVGERRG